MDKNGSGLINTDEFAAFIGELGVKIPRAELDHDTIGPDTVKGISFESRLRAGFLEADRDGSGSVSFKEFATCLMSKRRQLTVSGLLVYFDKMGESKTGEIEYKQSRKFMSPQSSLLNNPDEAALTISLRCSRRVCEATTRRSTPTT